METLNERYDALQENLLMLYEAGSDKIDDQIMYWDIMRQENVLFYYARKKNIARIGLQPVPSLTTSEHKAKQAIMMSLQLKSLKMSAYGKEPWTLQDTSFEVYNAAPSNTFKKGAFTVDVFYDDDEDNYYPYTAWSFIYYENGDGRWHKVEGQADYEGLYFITHDNEKNYYVTFDTDAARFSRTGHWTVKYKNHTISSTSVTSTSGNPAGDPSSREGTNTVGQETPVPQTNRRRQRESSSSPNRRTRQTTSQSDWDPDSSPSSGERLPRRRRRRERAPAAKRREQRKSTKSLVPSPEEVGRRHKLVEGKGLSRLRRLQEEAWDPPVLLLKGPANTLKCYRYRCKTRCKGLFTRMSTVFSWVGEGSERIGQPRMLLAFANNEQRRHFINTVHLPKGTEYSLGRLDSL